MGETVVPACSPETRRRFGFAAPADLLAAPLLHLVSRPDAWERWFEAHDVAHGGLRGMLFDQFATAAQAAISGLGVALPPKFLIEAELASGQLVEAVDGPIESAGRDCLVLARQPRPASAARRSAAGSSRPRRARAPPRGLRKTRGRPILLIGQARRDALRRDEREDEI